MTTLSSLGGETLLFPTMAVVAGAGALGVPERLDGESLFASMVTGALTSMLGDGGFHPPSFVGDESSVELSVHVAESFFGGLNGEVNGQVNGEVYPAPTIEKTVPPVRGFKISEPPLGSDLRPSPAPPHAPRWGLRWGDRTTLNGADDSEPSLWANYQPKEDSNDEVVSRKSSLRIIESAGIPTWASMTGAPLPWVPPLMPPLMPPEEESSPAPVCSGGSEPSGTLSSFGPMPPPLAGHGVSPIPFPRAPLSGGRSSDLPALLQQPAESVRAGNETCQVSTTSVAVEIATTRETVSGALQFQVQETGWQRVDSETPRPDPIGLMGPALRGSRSEVKTRVSPISRSVGIDASTGEPPSVVAALTGLSGESPSEPRVVFISGSSKHLEEESARWGSAAAGRWWSLSNPGSPLEIVATVSEPVANNGFPSQRDRTDAGRFAGGVPQMNIQPTLGQNPSVALTPVSGPEVAAREWLPSGFTKLRQPLADSRSASRSEPPRVLAPVFQLIPAPSAQPASETMLSKMTPFGERLAPVPIDEPVSGSGGQLLENAFAASHDRGTEEVVSKAAGDLKISEGIKSFPQPTNLPPSRSADIAYGGSGEPPNHGLLDKGSGSESKLDKNQETPEKKAFHDRATPSGKGGDVEVVAHCSRSGMTHAGAETAMASDRFQTSVPQTAPQRRGVGSLDSAPIGDLSVSKDTDPSMRMPPFAPAISELSRCPETAEGVALPQARSTTRLSDQLSGEVVLLQRLRTASMTAVLRPDAGSELRVELRRRDGRVEIRATLERGDAQAIAEGWPELQLQLRAQGVHLLPLEREGTPDSSKAFSDPDGERSAQSGGRGRNQHLAQDSGPGMGGEAGQKARSHPARSASPAALKPAHRPLLESWA